MNDPIDLTNGDPYSGPLEATSPGQSDEPHYPSVELSHPDLIHLPNKGKSVIEHEVVRRSTEKHPKGAKHTVRIHIKSIRPMGRKKAGYKHNASEGAMRDLMENE